MEAHTALIGPDGIVELNPESAIHVDLALVILPGYPANDNAIRLNESFQDLMRKVFRMLLQAWALR
jgi:hypothetical protein